MYRTQMNHNKATSSVIAQKLLQTEYLIFTRIGLCDYVNMFRQCPVIPRCEYAHAQQVNQKQIKNTALEYISTLERKTESEINDASMRVIYYITYRPVSPVRQDEIFL